MQAREFIFKPKIEIILKYYKSIMGIDQNKAGANIKMEYKILAYGDIGLRAWRKVKQEFYKKDSK